MKRFFTSLISILIMFGSVYAEPITPQKAKQIAHHFMVQQASIEVSDKTPEMKNASILNTSEAELISNQQEFYVFNHGDNQGFVIIAADDRVAPILGYSNQGSFDPDNIPANAQKWLDQYKLAIRYAIDNNIAASDEIREQWQTLTLDTKKPLAQKGSSVEPLLTTKWDQGNYYNELCPFDKDSNSHTLTGCVATAMAQVMKYWEFPSNGTGYFSYNHNKYGTLGANFGATTYQWAQMTDSVAAPNNAVATLMYQCGVSVEMDYSPDFSGAYVISKQSQTTHCAEYALKTHFGYSPNLIGLKKDDFNNAVWTDTLKNELNAGRPIIYAGFGDGGHCFVCDGYDADNYFHFNWGWSGICDGYFSLTALTPDGYSFTFNQQALIGIEPNRDIPVATHDLQMGTDLTCSENVYSFGDSIFISAKVVNYGTASFSGDIAAFAFNDDGYIIDIIGEQPLNLNNGAFQNLTFAHKGGKPLFTGTYYVTLLYKDSTDNWETVTNNIDGTNFDSLQVTYSNEIETFSNFQIKSNNGMLVQGKPATVNIDITNNGSSAFRGNYEISLLYEDGSFAQSIGTYNESAGLAVGNHYEGGLDFTGEISVSHGSYYMVATYKPDTSTTNFYIGSTNYLNPIRVIVQAQEILPDRFENNNTPDSAALLPVNFINDQASINTEGTNFHVAEDYDFYLLNLPSKYKYTIYTSLLDELNDTSYTTSGVYFFSTDGINFSKYHDSSIDDTLTLDDGGSIYFLVRSFIIGQLGTYNFKLNITRTIHTDVKDFANETSISVYPNPAKDVLKIAGANTVENLHQISLTDLQGRVIYSQAVKNTEAEIQVPLYDIPNGIYFVTLYTDQNTVSKKLIINK